MLEVRDISINYGAVRAVSNLTFGVGADETVALIGANGAGKSSILKAIMGIAGIVGGSIALGGDRLDGLATFQVVRRGVGYSPEGRRVFTATSVLENLHAGAHTLPKRDVASRLEQVLGYFPRLKERANQLAGSLSGGEQCPASALMGPNRLN